MSLQEFLEKYEEIFGVEEPEIAVEFWNAEEGRWLSSDER